MEESEKTIDKMIKTNEDFYNAFKDQTKVQPILFIQNPSDTASNILKTSYMLSTAPLVASQDLNISTLKKIITDHEYANNIKSASWSLDQNQKNITKDEVTNYIIQSLIVSFCNMLDSTGNLFGSLIEYMPIKNYVVTELNDKNSPDSIYQFISTYIYCQYQQDFGYSRCNTEKIDQVLQFNNLIVDQLCQLIYTKFCKAIDKAITEVLFGIRLTPNIDTIIEIGCKYFNISGKSTNIRNEIYIRLNAVFVHMLDMLMSKVYLPLINHLFNDVLVGSAYYLYEDLERKQFENHSEDI